MQCINEYINIQRIIIIIYTDFTTYYVDSIVMYDCIPIHTIIVLRKVTKFQCTYYKL